MHPPSERRRTLLGTFAVLSLVIVVAICVVLGAVLRETVRDRAIADAVRTAEVAAGVGVLPVLDPADLSGSFVPLGADRIADIDRSLGRTLPPNGIARIKVWNRQHWLVYSDNANLVGRWFAGTDRLEAAFSGEVSSEITDLSAPEERDERSFGELLSVYVPLRVDDGGAFTGADTGTVIGAFEIYLPYQPIAAEIQRDTTRLFAALAGGLLVLYLALFRVVAGASKTIKRQGEENLRRATSDELTGLANRERFQQHLTGLIERRRADDGPVSLLLFDVDGFQTINDTLGHDRGDLVLCQIAERLRSNVRSCDLVARLQTSTPRCCCPGRPHEGAEPISGVLDRRIVGHGDVGVRSGRAVVGRRTGVRTRSGRGRRHRRRAARTRGGLGGVRPATRAASALTEHAVLSDEAMRRAIDGGDIGPTLEELTRNTDGLTLAMGLVYGPAGASAFDQLWTNHIEFFNSYASAIRSGDEARATRVRVDLGHYESDFSDFVEVATAGELDFDTMLQVLHSHVGQLLQQADAWKAGDYDVAYETASDAYAHMDVIATALAGAVAAQQPDVFPGDLDGPARSTCASSRLAIGELIVAAADVELASRSDRPGDAAAASAAFEVARSAARESVGQVATDRLIVELADLGEATSVPAARTLLLSTEVAVATDSVCLIVD